ncbi:hypothetical protein BDV23DRAFT_190565 [Aspergillus alliaceus]|uniref:Uncharacterized protein n=1 Tax=Petromyces alliaceus TaxID=209559 RepID=A0A5N7BW05_PETAA|nr:hypothetical protein BDV23DRAFT_190565 [Aspergillus alliaceus]
MSILSEVFRSCLQGRRRQKQNHKKGESPPAVPPKDTTPYPYSAGEKKHELMKKPSIRVVERDEMEQPDAGGECRCGGRVDEEGEGEMAVKVSEDTIVAVEGETGFEVKGGCQDPEDHDKGDKIKVSQPQRKNTTTITANKLPEVKSRMIEDIPEETETEIEPEDADANEKEKDEAEANSTIPSKDEKGMPAWRLSRRKSLIEIINLLQATAAAAPKLSHIRLPVVPPKSTLRSRGSAVSLASTASSATVTGEEPPNPKKERRMGAVVFPGVRFGTRKWTDETATMAATMTTGKEKPLFC